jgi:hypothetical protein
VRKSLVATLLNALILFSIFNTLIFVSDTQEWVIENVSFTSSANTPVYPGSRGAKLLVEARYSGVSNATSPLGCLIGIPDSFTIPNKCSTGFDGENKPLTRVSPGELVRFVFNVDVDRNALPGFYSMMLNITYFTVEGGVQYSLLPLNVEIAEPPPLEIAVENAYLTPYAYPGANNIGLVVKIRNIGNTAILTLDATVHLPEVITPSTANITLGGIQPGDSATIYVQGLTISPSAQPGEHTISIELNATLVTSDGVRYASNTYVQASVTVSSQPSVNMQLLDYGLTAEVVLSGLNNTNGYVTLQSIEPGVINLIYYRAEILNGFFLNGSRVKLGELNSVLNYLDTYSLVIDGVSIDKGADGIILLLSLNVQVSREGASYPASINFTIYIPVTVKELSVHVLNVEWSSSNAYPSSTGNTLIVSILNLNSFTLRDTIATLTLPSVFYPQQVTVYNAVINAYSVSEIAFSGITISSLAQPGEYSAELTLQGVVVNRDGSTGLLSFKYTLELTVNDPNDLTQYAPELRILDYYWGDGTPIYVYPGNSRAPITITLQNPGPFSVSNVIVSLEAVDRDVYVLNTKSFCSPAISPGGICNAVFYVNLSSSLPGEKKFVVNTSYYVNAFNTAVFFEFSKTISLTLYNYPAGEGVVLAEYRWSNNYPAYPGSEKALYYFSIVNLEAYPVYSLWLEIQLPEGFKISQGYSQRIYVPGPVQSLQTLSYSIPLDISSNLTPGVYSGLLKVHYYLQTAGGGVRKTVAYPVEIVVQDPSSAFTLLSYGWLSGEPSPPSKGVKYFLVFRNNDIPSMTNPVLKLILPPGVTDASTGEAFTNAPSSTFPGGVSATPQLAQLIQYLYGNIPQGSSLPASPSSYTKGDIIVFLLNLNIESAMPDKIEINGTIDFVDHWGSIFHQPVSLPLVVRGSPIVLEVNATSPLIVFNNGTGLFELEINNPSVFNAYELYVVLAPLTGNAIPQGNVKYVPVLPGNSKQVIRYEVVYNPVSISIGPGVSATSLSTAFTATLIYKDSSGYVKMINNTVAAVIKPFIELQIAEETNAKYSSGVLTVNGLLYNTGVSQARSVVVTLKYGDKESKTLMGDLDPGSQSPFRLELKNIEFASENCMIIVSYRDSFNIEYSISKEIPVSILQPSPPLATTQPPTEVSYIAVIAIVSLFLIGVFLLIYRLISKYKITVVER